MTDEMQQKMQLLYQNIYLAKDVLNSSHQKTGSTRDNAEKLLNESLEKLLALTQNNL